MSFSVTDVSPKRPILRWGYLRRKNRFRVASFSGVSVIIRGIDLTQIYQNQTGSSWCRRHDGSFGFYFHFVHITQCLTGTRNFWYKCLVDPTICAMMVCLMGRQRKRYQNRRELTFELRLDETKALPLLKVSAIRTIETRVFFPIVYQDGWKAVDVWWTEELMWWFMVQMKSDCFLSPSGRHICDIRVGIS